MIEIRNTSGEPYVVETRIETSEPGVRIKNPPPPPFEIPPDQSVHNLGYEPGVWIKIRPKHSPERPRSALPSGTREG